MIYGLETDETTGGQTGGEELKMLWCDQDGQG